MSSRYQDIAKIRKDNRQAYRSTLYPTIPRSVEDIYVVVGRGDRLDLLAYQFYKSASYWWVIATANNIGHGSLEVEPGQQIRIPANLSQILSDLEKLNR